MEEIRDSYARLVEWIIENDRTGWDPYDGLNTSYSVLVSTKSKRLLSQYLHKFSPINLRPFFGVQESRQLQAAAFIGLALMENPGGASRDEFVRAIIQDLKESSLKETYGYDCWDAHGFAFQMRNSYHPAGTPDVVGSEACGRLLCQYALRYGDSGAKQMALSFRDFLLERFLVSGGDEVFFRYEPDTPSAFCTYNASLLGALYVMEMDLAEGTEKNRDTVEKCLRFVCSKQQREGYWCYTLNRETGEEKHQVDFHQGFILDCILRYMEVYGFRDPFRRAYERGLRFYRQRQFMDDGRGLYRLPRKWPVNIQNQAQGILTFARAEREYPEYRGFAGKIAGWTIRNMQDPSGYFYYLKYPGFTNKIPYMRWSDSGMAYALSRLVGESAPGAEPQLRRGLGIEAPILGREKVGTNQA